MNKILLLAFSLFFIASKAQISITSTNMPVSGDTARVSVCSLVSLTNPANTSYTLGGANMLWKFDSLKTTSQDIRNFQPALATPYFFYFFPPKYGEKTQDSLPIPTFSLGGFTINFKNIYSFYKKNGTSSFNAEGTGISIGGLPIAGTYSDEDELYMFPLNYNDKDSTTFKLATPSTSLVPFVYKKQGYRITQADGYGAVSTPYGTFQCLKVVTTQYSIDTIKVSIGTGTTAITLPFGFQNYVRSYQWLTLGEKIPVLEVSGNILLGNFTPTTIRYRDYIRQFVGIKESPATNLAGPAYPNPGLNEINIMVPQGNAVNLELCDASGKIVLKQELSNNNETLNRHIIDISKLSPGLYFGKMFNTQALQNFKFNKQ